MLQQQKTVLITGAYGGMGIDMAKAFIARGDNVVINGRDDIKLQHAKESLNGGENVIAVAGDISDSSTGEKMVEMALEHFGRVDVLVNNAGQFYPKPFIESTVDDLEHFFNVNLKGTYLTTQAAVRQMIKQNEGSIINVGTVLVESSFTPFRASAALASKGGVHALTTALASELAPYQIRVNTLAPGIIRTPLQGDNVDSHAGMSLLNRVGEVADTTRATLYLADASFQTGTVVNVDGGYVAGRSN
ncbi:SDR family oxidoreductase [Litoribacillus peritrichatus]|uniref:SDR family oxidoreductase n=1 Tax=Litoribacillus peritrichatus TaxID=718191 RepID=A0ABP7M825_9GAMM